MVTGRRSAADRPPLWVLIGKGCSFSRSSRPASVRAVNGTSDWRWPDFGEPELVERLLMEQENSSTSGSLAGQMPARPAATNLNSPPAIRGRDPDAPSLLAEGEGWLPADLGGTGVLALLEEFTRPPPAAARCWRSARMPSPGLWPGVRPLPHPADRTLLAVSGHLHDFDVGAAAELALYGAMPATIFPQPGCGSAPPRSG